MLTTMARSWYTIKAAQGETPAEISIYDEIGGWGVNARMFASDFKALKGDVVTLLINSPGGNVVDALAISNTMRHSGKTVNAKVMGIAASAASLLLTVCASVEMPENTFQFLHDPLDGMYGDADEHRAMADMLDKVAGPLVAMYATKSGKSEDEIRALLKADSLLTADECKALGLCDVVTPAVTATAKFEVDRLPDRVQALFKGNASLSDASTPFVTRVKALADKHGLGEFVSVWAAAADLTTIEAAQSAIAEACEVKAVCDVVGKPDLAPGFIKTRASLADARAKVAEVLAADDAARQVDTARSSKSVQGGNNPSLVLDTNDVWAKYRAMQQPAGSK
jgi:ATP-dependent protease ClpP protease subunit